VGGTENNVEDEEVKKYNIDDRLEEAGDVQLEQDE